MTFRSAGMRLLLAGWMAGVCLDAAAHDLLTAESVQAYLARVSQLQQILSSFDATEARARASLHLGQTLDEIGELFNRDIDAHGRVQGLASNVLMSELSAHGAPLAYSARSSRYMSNLGYYRDALRLTPSGPIAAQASLQLFRGHFYGSLGDDPLRPVALHLSQLVEQIRLGEVLRRDFIGHTQREEVTYILAIHYLQASRAAPAMRERYLRQATELIGEFVKAYPDSLRTATLSALLEGAAQIK